MNLRLFIAIDVPERIKRDIGEFTGILKKYDADVKWVKPENIHITLKFLGSTPDTLTGDIRESLQSIASPYDPFYINIQGAGVFPNNKYPRVLWAGIADSALLKELRDGIERNLSRFGFPREEREFHPHLTLGRVNGRRGMLSVINEISYFRGRQFGNFMADQVKLMKSELKPGGPEYTCLHSAPFGGVAARLKQVENMHEHYSDTEGQ